MPRIWPSALERIHARSTYEDRGYASLCRQHDCCNPDHLEAVTHTENMRRGIAAERARQYSASITHCPKGHEYTPENTKLRPHFKSGHMCRFCRECARIWARDYYQRNREQILKRGRERRAA